MYFKYEKIKRGRLDERIVNEYFSRVNMDLLNIYSNVDDVSEDVNITNKITVQNNVTINSVMNELKAKINEINKDGNIITNSLYNMNNIFIPSNIDDNEKGFVDTDFGAGRLGFNKTNTALTSIVDDELVASAAAANHISRIIPNNSFDEKADKVIENSIVNIIDPGSSAPYLLTVLTSNPKIESAGLIINITNLNFVINTIKIKPMPTLMLSINDFQMNTTSSNFGLLNPGGEEILLPLRSMGNILTTVPENTIKSVMLSLSNPYKSSTIPYEFNLGLDNISLEYNEYYNTSYIGFIFNVPKNESGEYKKLKRINFNWTYFDKYTSAMLYNDFSNANNVSNNYLDNIYETDGKTYSNLLEIGGDSLYVVVKLSKLENNTSPLIKSCTVEFA